VHQYFTQNAVGKRIKTGFNLEDETPLRQIIGVVGDVRRDSLTDNPPPAIYMPENELPQGGMRFVVRSSPPPQALADTMREAVWSVDKNLPVYEMKTLDQYLGLATGEIDQHFWRLAKAEIVAPAPHIRGQLVYCRLQADALGPSCDLSDAVMVRYLARAQALSVGLSNAYFKSRGLPILIDGC